MSDGIKSEPRVYSADSPHSFYIDRAKMTNPVIEGYRESSARLKRHGLEVATEIEARSAEGRRASKQVTEMRRTGAAEQRAASIATDAAFATPQWLTDLFPVFRSADRTYVNQCRPIPMPVDGMSINVPSFASGAPASTQQDNQFVGGVDPTGLDLNVPVVSQAGEAVISQQMFDRGGSEGASIDAIVQEQIQSQLNANIDLYTINAVIAAAVAAGSVVTDNTALTITDLFQDLSLGREKLTDTAGTRLAGTHLFTTSDLSGWITKQVDSQNRPIFLPDAGALLAAAASQDPRMAGFLGIALPGGLMWYADDNIPKAVNASFPASTGTNTQLLVSKPSEVLVWEGAPITFAYPETYAANLSVVVGLRKYLGVLPRYASATAVVSGTAFPTSLV